MSAIAKGIIYFGERAVVVCDSQCNKAWGSTQRPKVQLSDDEDDYAYLADHELGEAPEDPGTYEGDQCKPKFPEYRLNKWCVRECERSTMSPEPGTFDKLIEAPDFSSRVYNMTQPNPITGNKKGDPK